MKLVDIINENSLPKAGFSIGALYGVMAINGAYAKLVNSNSSEFVDNMIVNYPISSTIVAGALSGYALYTFSKVLVDIKKP